MQKGEGALGVVLIQTRRWVVQQLVLQCRSTSNIYRNVCVCVCVCMCVLCVCIALAKGMCVCTHNTHTHTRTGEEISGCQGNRFSSHKPQNFSPPRPRKKSHTRD